MVARGSSYQSPLILCSYFLPSSTLILYITQFPILIFPTSVKLISLGIRVLFPYNLTGKADKDSNYFLFVQMFGLLLNCWCCYLSRFSHICERVKEKVSSMYKSQCKNFKYEKQRHSHCPQTWKLLNNWI
jgi:hypothetical protein